MQLSCIAAMDFAEKSVLGQESGGNCVATHLQQMTQPAAAEVI